MDELYSKIDTLKSSIGLWDISLGENTSAGYVMGYYQDSDTKQFNVFINNERGKQKIRLSTIDEKTAIEKLISMMEFEVESNGRSK